MNSTRASRPREAIRGTLAIGERHRLETVSWGNAGDGNLHSSFLVPRDDREAVERAEMAAAEELNPGKKIETQR